MRGGEQALGRPVRAQKATLVWLVRKLWWYGTSNGDRQGVPEYLTYVTWSLIELETVWDDGVKVRLLCAGVLSDKLGSRSSHGKKEGRIGIPHHQLCTSRLVSRAPASAK